MLGWGVKNRGLNRVLGAVMGANRGSDFGRLFPRSGLAWGAGKAWSGGGGAAAALPQAGAAGSTIPFGKFPKSPPQIPFTPSHFHAACSPERLKVFVEGRGRAGEAGAERNRGEEEGRAPLEGKRRKKHWRGEIWRGHIYQGAFGDCHLLRRPLRRRPMEKSVGRSVGGPGLVSFRSPPREEVRCRKGKMGDGFLLPAALVDPAASCAGLLRAVLGNMFLALSFNPL